MEGIEPSYAAWEAAVLPLNYTRIRLRRWLYGGAIDGASRPGVGLLQAVSRPSSFTSRSNNGSYTLPCDRPVIHEQAAIAVE